MIRISSYPLVAALAIATAGLTGCAAPAAERIVVTTDATSTGINVNGTGEISARPDIGHLQIGVETRAPTAEQAMAQVNTRMAAVLAALKGAGIAEKDMRTNRVSLERELEPPQVGSPPVPAPRAGRAIPPAPPTTTPVVEVFHASTSIRITLRDLDRAGAIIGVASGAGANELGELQLGIDDPIPLERQARDKAMADARARAEQLARLAGVKLGPVVAVQESSSGHDDFSGAMFRAAETRAPIERGEIKVTRDVSVRFAIEK